MDFNNRQYDPQLGRFLQVDPLAAFGGQDMMSPYAAMGNMPEMMVDPLGLSPSFDRAQTGATDQAGGSYAGNLVNLLGSNVSGGGGGSLGSIFQNNFSSDFTYSGMSGIVLQMYYQMHEAERQMIDGQYYGSGALINSYYAADEDGAINAEVLPEILVHGRGHIWGWAAWRKQMDQRYGKKIILQIQPSLMISNIANMRNLPSRAARDGFAPYNPDALGISISANVMGISGVSGSLNIGFVGDEFGIWVTGGAGGGTPDVSVGVSAFMSEYTGTGIPTLNSYMGEGDATNFSIGPVAKIYGLPVSLNGGYSRGFNEGVTVWSTLSGGLSVGNPKIDWTTARGNTMTVGGYINGSYQRTYTKQIWPRQ